jgi:acyl dehydratase
LAYFNGITLCYAHPVAPFLVRAVNTAVDSENRIHDDSVAAEYGFRGGLVPGVTVYGYMASAVLEHFGPKWLMHGAMDVRFFEPVYEGEQVVVSIAEQEQGRIKVETGRALATAWLACAADSGDDPPEHPIPERVPASRDVFVPGALLGTIEKTLDLSQSGMSAPLDAWIGEERFAHPAILLALANEILVRSYILGPWIHSSSEIRNLAPARDGDRLHVRGKIVDAYERKGHEFVVLDVAILNGARPLSRIRHNAIWKPRK